MSFDDTFRERNLLPRDEVRQVTGINSRAEVLDIAGFGEPMTEWAQKAERIGQSIVPRTVYLVSMFEQHEHRVAWVYHSWRLPDSIEEKHHIACDCVAYMEDPDDEISDVIECPAVLASLEHRAEAVAKILRIPEVLGQSGKKEDSATLKRHSIIAAKAMINFVMNYEQAHPEGWIANIESGEHQVPLLSLLMQIQPTRDGLTSPDRLSMQDIVQEMDIDGSLVLHDDELTVSLPQAA